MFEDAYKASSTDVLPGLKGTYVPPERFEHGVRWPVAHLTALNDDGRSVVVFETRMPARFFRMEAYATRRPHNTGVLEFVLETGTMEPRLVAEIANAIAEGMLGVER